MPPPPKSNNDYNWEDVWRSPPPPGSPAARQAEKDFNWGGVAPDPAHQLPPHLAPQLRIMIAAGKGRHEITRWLRQNGLAPAHAAAVVAGLAEPCRSNWWERFCGRASLVLIAGLSLYVLVLVVVQRPWDGNRWEWKINPTSRGEVSHVDSIAGFLLFCFLYAAAMAVLWYLARRFGSFLDLLHDKEIGKRLWIALLLSGVTVAALVALLAKG